MIGTRTFVNQYKYERFSLMKSILILSVTPPDVFERPFVHLHRIESSLPIVNPPNFSGWTFTTIENNTLWVSMAHV